MGVDPLLERCVQVVLLLLGAFAVLGAVVLVCMVLGAIRKKQ